MKTLSHLQNEAVERFEKEFVGGKAGKIYSWNAKSLTDCTGVRNFLKTELTNIVKESFKNTRVERKDERPLDPFTNEPVETYGYEETYNQALGDKHNKESEFLGK